MFKKLMFFWKASREFYFKPKLSFGNICHYDIYFYKDFAMKKPIIGSSKISITMSLKYLFNNMWYEVLAHEIGHTLDHDSVWVDFDTKTKEGKEALFKAELEAWKNARELMLFCWGNIDRNRFKKAVIFGLGSYLVYCYEPQYRADVWYRVEKELGIWEGFYEFK